MPFSYIKFEKKSVPHYDRHYGKIHDWLMNIDVEAWSCHHYF